MWKGIAIAGIWIGIAIVGTQHAEAAAFMSVMGMFATIAITYS